MKKRILCLLLGLVMALSVFLTSCGDSGATDTSQENAIRANTSLSFWIITEDGTSEESIEDMQKAFNLVCKQKYSTEVIFTVCTADEYEEKLNEKLAQIADAAARQEAEKDSVTAAPDAGSDAKEERDNYPGVTDTQLDIVLVNNKALYEDLARRGILLSLNSDLAGAYKNIATTVYSELLDYSAINNAYYAIPNKRVIGEYTYLLVDKEMATKYNKTESQISTVASVYDLVQSVAENEDPSKMKPLLAPFEYPTLRYWSMNNTIPCLVGTIYSGSQDRGEGVLQVNNLFKTENYRKYATMMFDAELNDYYVTNEDQRFAVGVVSGDFGARYEYEANGYYCVPVNNPRITEEDVYGAMFGVSVYTVNKSRSLEIIYDLLVNSELRNILQYGVANENYLMNADGTVTLRSTNEYFMNPDYTGSVFTLYPCTNNGQNAGFIAEASGQNRDHCTDVFYKCESHFSEVDESEWARLEELSAKIYARLDMCVTTDEYRETVEAFIAEMEGSGVDAALVQKMTAMYDSVGNANKSSIAGSLLDYAYSFNK